MSFKVIISGETGCGKTYKVINDEKEANRCFIYLSPCRQLLYETYRYYANPEEDTLSSGEIKLNIDKDKNYYGIYESLQPEIIQIFDTLIIDEAHFIHDQERGGTLSTILATAIESDVNIKLVTATQDFNINGFDNVKLKARYKVPKKVEITFREALANIDKGMQTIWFCSSIRETTLRSNYLSSKGIKTLPVNSSLKPSERIKAQIAFERKEVQVICSTNVLAQGVNFECENLIIDSDLYETNNQLLQKLGRLGRPGTLIGKNEVYYCTYRKPKDIKNKVKIDRFDKVEPDKTHIQKALNTCITSLNNGFAITYNDVKYCIPEFIAYATEFLNEKPFKFDIKRKVKRRIQEDTDFIDRLKKILEINKDNSAIEYSWNIDYMYRAYNWFGDPDRYPVSICDLDEVIKCLTKGSLNYYKDYDKITDDYSLKRHLIILELLETDEVRRNIKNRISTLESEVEDMGSDDYIDRCALFERDKDRAVKRFNKKCELMRNALMMIKNEQNKLESLIIGNMRELPDVN